MVRCKSVAFIAAVCMSIAIGAIRMKHYRKSAAINQVNKDEELGGKQAELVNTKETKAMTAVVPLEEKATDVEKQGAKRQAELDLSGEQNLNDLPPVLPTVEDEEPRAMPEQQEKRPKVARAETARHPARGRVNYARLHEGLGEESEEARARAETDAKKQSIASAAATQSRKQSFTVRRRRDKSLEQRAKVAKAAKAKKYAKLGGYEDDLKEERWLVAEAKVAQRAAEKAADPCSGGLENLRIGEVQERCRRANLSDVGTKAVLVDALRAKKRANEEGVDSSDDTEELSLWNVGQAEQVASLNFAEHEFAEWLEHFERIEDNV